jgi:hypothetical protein
MYAKKNLNSYFYTTKGFYVFFIPVKVPYKQVYGMADSAGLKKKEAFGPILEKGQMLGSGWVGVEIEKPAETRPDVIHISGDFEMYEHKGPYKTLGKAYKKIMKDRPHAKEYYNFYLDDPEKTKPEDCRTQVLFR